MLETDLPTTGDNEPRHYQGGSDEALRIVRISKSAAHKESDGHHSRYGPSNLSHFKPERKVAFYFNARPMMVAEKTEVPTIVRYLDTWTEHGLGHDIRPDKYWIEAVSPKDALCFLIWSIHPPAECRIES